MIAKKNLLVIRVECYSGYRGEETPRRLVFTHQQVEVVEILDRWLAPDHRYFKLKGDDGAIYIIRHEVTSRQWELTLYDRASL
ncbi:hypothetical protein [Desulfogranum mediterraneum]|uniref:hypothetical protein n=1 Tax=Desulfogranum mediterraneum TaxID=160661 RepID=UPI0003F7DFC9|nr:hypothetical protein [Desulfogranum mediterraneum]